MSSLSATSAIPALKQYILDATSPSCDALKKSKADLEDLKTHICFGLERLRANAAKGNTKAKDNLDMFEGWLDFANAMLGIDEGRVSQSECQSEWQVTGYFRDVKFCRKLVVTQWPKIENGALIPIAEEAIRLYLETVSVEGVKKWNGYPKSMTDLVERAVVMERIKDGERPDPSSIVCGDNGSGMIFAFLDKYKSVAESSWMNFLCGRKTDTSGLDGVVTWSDSEYFGLALERGKGGAFEAWSESKKGEAPPEGADFPALFEWKWSEIVFNVTFDWRDFELSEMILKVKDLAPSNVLNMLLARVLPNPELCVKDNLMTPCINVLRRKGPPTGAVEMSMAWTLLGLYYEFKEDNVRARACFAKGVDLNPSSAAYFGLCRVTPDGERIQFGGKKGSEVKGGLPWGGMYCRWFRDKELSFGATLIETPYEFKLQDAPIGGACVESVTWQAVAEEYYKNEMFSACLKACEKGGLEGEILGMARCRNCEYKEAMGMERRGGEGGGEGGEFANYAKVRGRRGVVERAWEEGKRGLAMRLLSELEMEGRRDGGFVGLKDIADMKMIVGKGGREEFEELLRVVEEGGGGSELAPFKNRIYYDIGVTYYEEGKVTDALKFMVKSVECDPKSAFGWNGAGVCLEALGREGGRECFEVAKACGKDNEGWINAVVCDWHAGRDPDESLGELTSVSEHALSWLVRGLVYDAEGRKGGAEGILTAAKSYLKSAVGLVEVEGDELATERWRRVWEGMGGAGEEAGEGGGLNLNLCSGRREEEVEAEAKQFDEVVKMVKNKDSKAGDVLETICERNERVLRGSKMKDAKDAGTVSCGFVGEMKALRAWYRKEGGEGDGGEGEGGEGGGVGSALDEAQMAAFFAPHSVFVRTAIQNFVN
ncbi:hypothetical protein TrST_g3380 [Triparma strigata]|uniref:Uncharacterized protein n=1 Tax=Triparma strigata TaxID=1606541 RepID=A0A9W7BVD4_9STRA|nr:hypothetical protein TrST_g3380 [Triparma strigata]